MILLDGHRDEHILVSDLEKFLVGMTDTQICPHNPGRIRIQAGFTTAAGSRERSINSAGRGRVFLRVFKKGAF